jgi:hypothetical protein
MQFKLFYELSRYNWNPVLFYMHYIIGGAIMNSLEQAISLAPILTKILKEEDFIVAITDTENYVYCSPGKFLDPGIQVGHPFLE